VSAYVVEIPDRSAWTVAAYWEVAIGRWAKGGVASTEPRKDPMTEML